MGNNIQPWDGWKPAWGYACQEEPCFGQTVVAAIIYGFVETDSTCRLPKHIQAPDLGPNESSYVHLDLGPEHKYASVAYRSNPFPQVVYQDCRSTRLIHFQHHSFCSTVSAYKYFIRRHCRTLFKTYMSSKGGKKNPAKIIPGDQIGEPLPWDSQRAGEHISSSLLCPPSTPHLTSAAHLHLTSSKSVCLSVGRAQAPHTRLGSGGRI